MFVIPSPSEIVWICSILSHQGADVVLNVLPIAFVCCTLLKSGISPVPVNVSWYAVPSPFQPLWASSGVNVQLNSWFSPIVPESVSAASLIRTISKIPARQPAGRGSICSASAPANMRATNLFLITTSFLHTFFAQANIIRFDEIWVKCAQAQIPRVKNTSFSHPINPSSIVLSTQSFPVSYIISFLYM